MALFSELGLPLRLNEFRQLRDLMRTRYGLHFRDDSRFVFERRLRERVSALGLVDFAEYYRYLRYHPDGSDEMEQVVDLLTTNETYFFRDRRQLKAFQREVLPALKDVAAHRGRLSVWSAGCSTGEEVYTLAMLIRESRLFDSWIVRVYGNDISRRVLQTARRGVYGDSSFRAMPPEYGHYLEPTANGRQVDARIRGMCRFGQFNLLETERAAVVIGRVDAILCRNVLIYFDDPARKALIQSLYERLFPGGFLMLGHSESLLNMSTAFELANLSGDLAYRKPLLGARK